jgi:ElaB/YqjD/DUF883 family membrane-anchored ribosome-binding protein
MNAPLATAIAGKEAGRTGQTTATPFEELFDGVDDLIRRVAQVENPEIRKIRAKVHAAMVAAKSACDEHPNRDEQRSHADPLTAPIADESEEFTGQSLSLALLLGVGLGLVVSLRQ